MTRKVSLALSALKLKPIKGILKRVNQLSQQWASMSDKDLRYQTYLLRQRLAEGDSLDMILPEAFATVREAAKRVLGMYPFDVQVMGAIVLHQGRIAEMKTGEGKTLTATMPLYLNALEGKGAILVTTNEYLAVRDAKEMEPLYHFLGLNVGIGVTENKENDLTVDQKRDIYQSDIVYTTSAALGFDYLIENLASSSHEKFLRGFHYIIVDEADAILLDIAQTPLIISGSPRVQSNLYMVCQRFVETLKENLDYKYDKDKQTVYLLEEGMDWAETFFNVTDIYDGDFAELNRHINLALRAKHLYQKGRDYVVQDEEVKLLDNRTGRLLEGTRLQSGIHQAIETKEGLNRSQESRAMASITYQNLFNLFPKLSGMTGTGKSVESELLETYGMDVVLIPTHRPVQRQDLPDQIFVTLPEKLYATLGEVKRRHSTGQPILLISGTVEVAEIYSKMLLQEGIAHSLLTANNLAKEAMIIKEAGQLGAVTVATSLAGRGTDIKLGVEVASLGGLAVLGTERMANSRIDWQLRGRAGRQGDPGISQFFISLEDDLILKQGPKWLKDYFEKNDHANRSNYGLPLKARRFKRAINQAQLKSEDEAADRRYQTVQFDEALRIQRQLVYGLREKLINQQGSLAQAVEKIVNEMIEDFVEQRENDSEATLKRHILENYSYQFKQLPGSVNPGSDKEVKALLWKLFSDEMTKKQQLLKSQESQEEFFRLCVLKAIDSCWIEEVDHLQQLKAVVISRSLAQRNSMYEYYQEAFRSYEDMARAVKVEVIRHAMLSTIRISRDGEKSIYFA
ncbi:accessory Sec system translocase SecA2 [Streptococcus dysgalactiae]|uniref:accessory Sec system translocase SecA2 n=1 Tax=Streptococcus dysgalactiae TaxID=1334 RepID=UPI0024B6B5BA|nr:accessory Sec system translocase SecA2 [Streptococcus dysgalactiae]